MIACCEPAFPRLLAAVDPPPPFLWALGDPALLQRPTVALVGARIASASGCRFARALAGALGEAGYVVVSGMARGIDAAAHEGALQHGTAAVLAGGVDNIFPPEHGGLHRALVERGLRRLRMGRWDTRRGRPIFRAATESSPVCR